MTIRVNRALNSINLLDNDLGEDGLAYIATAWEQSNTLRSICGIAAGATTANLSDQGLGKASARIIALELRFNRALNSVDLRNNRIPGAGKQQLRDAVKGKNITLQL